MAVLTLYLILILAVMWGVLVSPAASIEVHTGESIKAAIDATNAGGGVIIYPGTYSEHIEFKGVLLLVAENEGDSTLTFHPTSKGKLPCLPLPGLWAATAGNTCGRGRPYTWQRNSRGL